MVGDDGKAQGVRLADGNEVLSRVVLSNATPKVTFIDLLKSGVLPETYLNKIKSVDYSSPVTKINGRFRFCFRTGGFNFYVLYLF